MKDFPGTARPIAERLVSDVMADEKAIIAAIRNVRMKESAKLDEIGFLLGVAGGQISRYLSGQCNGTLRTYLRIARALGYRCHIVLEKAEEVGNDGSPASDQRLTPHRVLHLR